MSKSKTAKVNSNENFPMFGGGASLAAAQIQQQQAIPSVLSESGQSTKLTLAAIAYDIAVRAKREQFGDPEKAIIYQIFLREFDKLKDSFASCITIYPVGHRLAFLRRFESLCNNVSCTLHKSLKTGTIQGSNYKNLDTEQKDLFRELKTLTKIIEDKQTELLRKILAEAETYQLANKQAAEKLAEASGGKAETKGENWHNEDFTKVRWDGKTYKFDTQQQTLAIKYLWENKRAREKNIGEVIGSSADNFRLFHIFRQKGKKKTKMHPAWGTMIVPDGKGVYALAEKKNPPKK